MKTIVKITLGFAIAVSPVFAAQDQEPDKDKPRQDQPKKQEPAEKAKPQQEKQEPVPTQKDQQKAEEKQKQQGKQDEKQNKEGGRKAKEKPEQQGQSARQGGQNQQASGGREQRIPPQKFQASFGNGHHFHVHHLESGNCFQYGGYWFAITQPWPAGWSYDDDCYIEEDGDEYFLVDVLHPDFRLVVIVVEA